MIRADDIVRQRFTKVFRGYDIQEVDLFLDEIIRTMDAMQEENNTLLVKLDRLLKELAHCDALLSSYQQSEAQSQQKAQGAEIAPTQEAAPLKEAACEKEAPSNAGGPQTGEAQKPAVPAG